MRIAIIGTLDTKGNEVRFIRDTIAALGHDTLIFDPGTLGQPAIPADVSRAEIARAAGWELPDLLATRDKALIQSTMTQGLVALVSRLHREGAFQGIIAVGGAQGSAIATAAMRALPVGVPKFMVSTVACGKTTFGPYVGTKDIAMLHSVADISGLNRITRRLLAQAARAVVAMAAEPQAAETPERELIAITQAGITTPGVMAVKERLENLGFEVVAFHCNGIGGQAMEELIAQGEIRGLIDFSPHEITDLLFGGLMPAAPDRMKAAGLAGIPQVVVPGCTDIRLHGVGDELPPDVRDRARVQHSPTHTHVRTTPEEMEQVARFIATRLNECKGPRASVIPLRGYSMLNKQGHPLYDEEANMAYVRTMRRELHPEVRQVEVDAHINDSEFADVVVETFMSLRREAQKAASGSG
ncbi:MAG: Tm-1-like ATP-binding domain-containing protein [Anaerolineae bacterium]|nr:Tm-1-like ATP-binding domain-containing protein [Anaerolineae bacterium]